MGDQAWIFAIMGSTISWALADLILDITIGEEVESVNRPFLPVSYSEDPPAAQNDHHDDVILDSIEAIPRLSPTKLPLHEEEKSAMQHRKRIQAHNPHNNNGTPVSHSPPPYEDKRKVFAGTNPHHHQQHIYSHMSGDQDTAVAGLVTIIIVYLMCIQRWFSHRQLARNYEEKRLNGEGEQYYELSSGVGGIWSPFHDFEWWIAAFSGLLLFVHYLTLYWAYDTAPSTVINPLLQVSSTWVLLGTAIPAILNGTSFMQPFDLFCYAIIVVGGLLPSLQGDFKAMLKLSFWKQGFVKYAALSEFSLGLYDLLLSWVIRSARNIQMTDQNENILENEFFFIAWCWFVVAFAFTYGLHPRLQEEYQDLTKVSPKTLALAGLGQIIMFVGYYFSQFGYSWFYQASVVHAAEASMAQAFNLIAAFVAKKCFNLGRDSAVQAMKYKVISVIIVSVGLFLIAFRDLQP